MAKNLDFKRYFDDGPYVYFWNKSLQFYWILKIIPLFESKKITIF